MTGKMTEHSDNRPTIRQARHDHFHGILLVDKPGGITSHDVVARIRHKFAFKKVGHGGTLDPMATGLLVILLGRKATRLSGEIMGGDKTYAGTLRLGIATNTQDADGQIISEADPSAITREMLAAEMAKFQGDIQQIPPMVSAIKQNGVPLYKLARKEQEVEREARLRHIYSFRLSEFNPPQADFVLKCSKGTYVRTLCHDIGANLGCGGHLAALRRLASGDFDIEEAYALNDILDMDLDQLAKALHRLTALG
jgi:tRNA pseudouridine55 synthase